MGSSVPHNISGNAANVTTPLVRTITNAAAGVGGLVRITTSVSHGFSTGDQVNVIGVVGTTEANKTTTVNVIDATKFDMVGTTYANAYVSGGTVTNQSLTPMAQVLDDGESYSASSLNSVFQWLADRTQYLKKYATQLLKAGLSYGALPSRANGARDGDVRFVINKGTYVFLEGDSTPTAFPWSYNTGDGCWYHVLYDIKGTPFGDGLATLVGGKVPVAQLRNQIVSDTGSQPDANIGVSGTTYINCIPSNIQFDNPQLGDVMEYEVSGRVSAAGAFGVQIALRATGAESVIATTIATSADATARNVPFCLVGRYVVTSGDVSELLVNVLVSAKETGGSGGTSIVNVNSVRARLIRP